MLDKSFALITLGFTFLGAGLYVVYYSAGNILKFTLGSALLGLAVAFFYHVSSVKGGQSENEV